jgi:hypothetical protein
MLNGGRRSGAGRPKGSKAKHTIQGEAFRVALIAAVLKEKAPLIRALIDKAKGGDIPALKEINDRVLGKSTESIDLTSKGNELKMPTLIKVVAPNSTTEDAA